jgi:hypothetical protein
MLFIRKFIDPHKCWEYLEEKYETKIKIHETNVATKVCDHEEDGNIDMDECLKNVKEIIDQLESAIITLPF